MKSINIKSIIAFALFVVAIGFTSCKSGNKTETKETTKVEETHSETIEVSEEQMKAVGIEKSKQCGKVKRTIGSAPTK
jgi:cobalt-zinc-cadmium efflux system membrane fusion protein